MKPLSGLVEVCSALFFKHYVLAGYGVQSVVDCCLIVADVLADGKPARHSGYTGWGFGGSMVNQHLILDTSLEVLRVVVSTRDNLAVNPHFGLLVDMQTAATKLPDAGEVSLKQGLAYQKDFGQARSC